MEVRPGYKQTEVGVIPEDWDVGRRLGEHLSASSTSAQDIDFTDADRGSIRTFQSQIHASALTYYQQAKRRLTRRQYY